MLAEKNWPGLAMSPGQFVGLPFKRMGFIAAPDPTILLRTSKDFARKSFLLRKPA